MVSCGEIEAPSGTVTRITIDMNPSVELLVNDQGKLSSAVGLNDDGALLVAGEEMVGKTADEAVEIVITVAAETGYLVKGNAENTLKLSVSGDSDYAEALTKKLTKKAKRLFKELDISGAVELVEALKTDALRALVLKSSLYSEEALANMSDEELYRKLSEGREETSLVITEELRETLLSEKNYAVELARTYAVADIIEGLGEAYLPMLEAYKTAIGTYREAISALNSLRYEVLLSPDSAYQTSLVVLREAKTELLKQRAYVASLDEDDVKYTAANLALKTAEAAYEVALASYEALGSSANSALDALIKAISSAESALTEFENTHFSTDLKKDINERSLEIEAALFKARTQFFTDFEKTHGEDARAVKQALIDKKAALKEAISSKK